MMSQFSYLELPFPRILAFSIQRFYLGGVSLPRTTTTRRGPSRLSCGTRGPSVFSVHYTLFLRSGQGFTWNGPTGIVKPWLHLPIRLTVAT